MKMIPSSGECIHTFIKNKSLQLAIVICGGLHFQDISMNMMTLPNNGMKNTDIQGIGYESKKSKKKRDFAITFPIRIAKDRSK